MLDLRTPAEFELEHIQGSINIPLDTLQTEDLAKMYEGKTIFLICGTGKLAYTAAAKFHDYGYFDVTVIAGGLLAWRVLGYPLARLK